MTFQIKETVWSGNRPTIGYVAQFEEDKMTFHAISSPTHVEAMLKSILDFFVKIKSMAPSSQSIIVSNEIIASTYYKRIIKKKSNEIIEGTLSTLRLGAEKEIQVPIASRCILNTT